MSDIEKLLRFSTRQINTVNKAAEISEELVCDYYKLSTSQWLRRRYDIKTIVNLSTEEIIDGPFAQIIKYKAQPKNSSLSSSTYDFYKICLQDNSILSVVDKSSKIKLYPFLLYIITHELVHIVRFSEFLQNFSASYEEKMAEEARVHYNTHEILKSTKLNGLSNVFKFYDKWRIPLDELQYDSHD
ncbi:MAG: hypothetical protein FP814_10775 [Desulfobacterium sp.]|nr:hypothetical protein [Desulfobacterium sp.]MBU3948242.1 hypothetical protein [Pseudomonadota bacterium]MBU4034862.1 hypothetical protein [Pseudomonadota bacterium]